MTKIANRYNEDGPDSLGDRRHNNLLSHVFGHDERCPACGARRWVFDAVLGPWRVRRELLALGIDRSPREFAPARGPPSLW